MNKDHNFLRVEEKVCSVPKSIKPPKWKNLLFFRKAVPGNNGGLVSDFSLAGFLVGEGVQGAKWEVWGEVEMPVSGPGILPTKDTSAATPLWGGLLAAVCREISEVPLQRLVGGHET